LRLRSRVLHGHADSARSMPQRYRGCHFVNILTTWAGRARKSFLEVGLADAEVQHPFSLRMLRHHDRLKGKKRTTGTTALGQIFFK
jgi:hypothetical protein